MQVTTNPCLINGQFAVRVQLVLSPEEKGAFDQHNLWGGTVIKSISRKGKEVMNRVTSAPEFSSLQQEDGIPAVATFDTAGRVVDAPRTMRDLYAGIVIPEGEVPGSATPVVNALRNKIDALAPYILGSVSTRGRIDSQASHQSPSTNGSNPAKNHSTLKDPAASTRTVIALGYWTIGAAVFAWFSLPFFRTRDPAEKISALATLLLTAIAIVGAPSILRKLTEKFGFKPIQNPLDWRSTRPMGDNSILHKLAALAFGYTLYVTIGISVKNDMVWLIPILCLQFCCLYLVLHMQFGFLEMSEHGNLVFFYSPGVLLLSKVALNMVGSSMLQIGIVSFFSLVALDVLFGTFRVYLRNRAPA